jgi:hypothetical protein
MRHGTATDNARTPSAHRPHGTRTIENVRALRNISPAIRVLHCDDRDDATTVLLSHPSQCTKGELVKPRIWILSVFVLANAAISGPAWAQSAAAPTVAPAPKPSVQDDPAVLVPAEPDVVVVNLPTTLRMPLFKGNFRLTHRFAGNLRNGSFGEQAGNLFGLDQGAIIGFEYRMAVVRDVQAAFYRSSFAKTIQLYGKYDALRQRGSIPVSVSGLVSIEGTNNFQQQFAPAVGVVVSRLIGTRVAAYVTPMWVDNTDASLAPIGHEHDGTQAEDHAEEVDATVGNRSTTYAGFGGRVRVAGSTYIAAEVVVRASGYVPDEAAYGFSLEKRVGGHTFSLTFTNTLGTTFAQLARGGAANSLYLGFNLSRKFF